MNVRTKDRLLAIARGREYHGNYFDSDGSHRVSRRRMKVIAQSILDEDVAWEKEQKQVRREGEFRSLQLKVDLLAKTVRYFEEEIDALKKGKKS